MSQVRTRFAPSPTGSLHLGNLRIAVFSQLFARHHGGGFILRVEDTDTARNVEGSLEGILEDLRWAGLDWDEGPEVGGPFAPYRQSERGWLHREAALRLEERKLAYRCFCADPDEDREGKGEARDAACPGRCRELTEGQVAARREADEPSALRFAIPTEEVSFRDEVRGEITWKARDVGDFVVLRSDGRATYNFAVVVDDVAMKITHVIRGAGHLSNTPKQALLFDALDAPRPLFVHLPTVLGPDRRKLSKREGAPGVAQLRAAGYHPDAVVNYLSLLGWSPGGDREVMTRKQLVEAMDLEGIGASDTVFDPDKMRWLSAQHIASMPLEELVEAVSPRIDRDRFPLGDEELPAAVEAIRTRLTVFGDVNEHLALLFPGKGALEEGQRELKGEEGAGETLERILAALDEVAEWTPSALGEAVRAAGREADVGGRRLFHPVRLALTGSRQGPDVGSLLAALGPTRARKRILDAVRALASAGTGDV
jgi:nondiscriminating glutamyl-tRNA synthetase